MLLGCCFLQMLGQSCWLKSFLRTLILKFQISLYAFLSRNNLRLHNILVTTKLAKKFIIKLDFSEVSRPDCIPVVVLKNGESEILYCQVVLIFLSRNPVLCNVGKSHMWSLSLGMCFLSVVGKKLPETCKH